ncbi:MAG TPA: hypothetical protein VFB72_19160 [Verrucomicrobiae bacterium]|nr:hypothetical protein [Verrucomicrobiae bacterium]
MPNSAKPQSSSSAPRGLIEPADVNAEGVFFFVVGLIITVALCLIILGAIFQHFRKVALAADAAVNERAVVPSATKGRLYFPPPHEQFSPQLDLQAFKAEQERDLNTYGWIDKKAGVVRIPIARAMDLLLQRGVPTRSGSNIQTGPSNLELQRQRPEQSSPPQKEEGSK